MQRYMLDTNMCIYLMKNQPEQVAQRLSACLVGDVIMSSITFAELEFGIMVSTNRTRDRRNLNALVEDIPVVAFDGFAAREYGLIRFASREKKKDSLDKLIAAHAISLDAVLVTNNERDFNYRGLTTENWTK